MFTVNTRITPTEVILSREVEAYVRKNPFRFCDHDGCIIEYDREYRQYTCRTCGTTVMSKKDMLMAGTMGIPVDAIRIHLATSVLIQCRRSMELREVTPEDYKIFADQGSIDVLRFPPVDKFDPADPVMTWLRSTTKRYH